MNEFDKIFWGFIFSAIGILFGWTLNQMGQWFRTREEDKKNLKTVLFNLLEIYFLFIRSDFDKIIKQVTNKVFDKLPIDQRSEEGKVIIYQLYQGIATTYLKPDLIEEIKSVQENYKNAIKTLASIDPITAYYLSGKTEIMKHFDSAENWFDNMKEQFPDDEEQINFVANKAIDFIKPDILNDVLDDLEDDITNIAFKINPYVWYKSKKAIKRLKTSGNEKIDKEIDNLFERIETLMVVQ